MKLILIVLVSLTFSCQSVHEYCTIHAAEFGGYESCYEKEWERRQVIAGAVRQGSKDVGDSMKSSKPTDCTTTSTGTGAYKTYHTTCK